MVSNWHGSGTHLMMTTGIFLLRCGVGIPASLSRKISSSSRSHRSLGSVARIAPLHLDCVTSFEQGLLRSRTGARHRGPLAMAATMGRAMTTGTIKATEVLMMQMTTHLPNKMTLM